jgi:F0F1-type ATP synthase membrane subunit b/b'
MVIVNTSWKRWAAGLAVSLIIFLVLYLTVIQPSTNTANQAIKTGEAQTQQAIKQAQQQINSAGNQATGASGRASKHAAAAGAKANKQIAAAGKQANQQLNQAGKLAACVSAAGSDTGKLQTCQVKYTP